MNHGATEKERENGVTLNARLILGPVSPHQEFKILSFFLCCSVALWFCGSFPVHFLFANALAIEQAQYSF
jgi:hypothetical protein